MDARDAEVLGDLCDAPIFRVAEQEHLLFPRLEST